MNSVEHPVCGSYYIRSSCATQRVFSGLRLQGRQHQLRLQCTPMLWGLRVNRVRGQHKRNVEASPGAIHEKVGPLQCCGPWLKLSAG